MRRQDVKIQWPSGRYILHLPEALDGLPLSKLKKIFDWLFQNLWEGYPANEQTVRDLDEYISDWVADLKRQWGEASVKFQNGYRDPKFSATTREARAEIKRENDSLLRKVKAAKRAYERSEKVLTAWTEIKAKHT